MTERAFAGHGLFKWFRFPVGNALVKRDGMWSFLPAVSDYDLVGADRYFQGGRDHVIDQATRDELVAAGLGSYITGV